MRKRGYTVKKKLAGRKNLESAVFKNGIFQQSQHSLLNNYAISEMGIYNLVENLHNFIKYTVNI